MNKKEKIITCYGHLNTKSISIIVGSNIQYVYHILRQTGLKSLIKNKHRTLKGLYKY